MKICDTLKKLFKGSGKSFEESLKELQRDMQLVKVSAEEFEKKSKNLIGGMIKKVHSLTEEEKEQKVAEVSRGFQYLRGANADEILRTYAPPIKRKYDIMNKYLHEYQDVLRKSMNHS